MTVLVIPQDPDTCGEDEASILDAFKGEFERRVKHGEPHGVWGWGRHLISLYRKRGDQDALRETARRIARSFEDNAETGGATLALSLLQQAHVIYKDAGLSADAARVRCGIADAVARSKSEMTTLETKFEIKTADLETYADAVTEGGLDRARINFFGAFRTSRKQAQEQLARQTEASPMMSVMDHAVVDGDAQNLVGVPAPEREIGPNLVRAAGFLMSCGSLSLQFTADRLVTRYDLTPDTMAKFGETCGTFPPSRRELRRQAFAAYLSGEYAIACHLLVPQVEHALRLLLRHAGDPTNTTDDDRTWRQMTLGAVLNNEKMIRLLGDDLSFYLRVLLCEDLGWNVRDLVCHGLVSDRWFARDISDRLLHAVVALSIPDLAKPKLGNGASDDDNQPECDSSNGADVET